jgi:CHASE2 domain-containing sensor protein
VRSEQATLRIVAPFYTPSRKVVVVLVDDAYLHRHQIGWPLAYAAQGQLLRQILSVGPAVLVIDLVYPHRHATATDAGKGDDVSQLIDRIAQNTTTPIIFTAMAKEAEALPANYHFCERSSPINLLDPESMLPELHSALHPLWTLSYIRWSGCGTRYPLLLGDDPKSPTPAFAAYRAYCGFHPTLGSCGEGRPAVQPQSFREAMTVRWGAFPPPEQAFAFGADTCQAPAAPDGQVSVWRKLKVAIAQLTLGIFQDSRSNSNHEIGLPCPAVTVIPLSALEQGSADDWHELLKDKIVVLGANVSGIPDFIDSPVHGLVPGAVLHAMALDNLLTLGPRYLADRQSDLRRILTIALVALFAYALPFLLSLFDHIYVRRFLALTSFALWTLLSIFCLWLGEPRLALASMGFGICFDVITPPVTAVYFYAIIFAALVSIFQLNSGWPPGNWLGLLLLVLAFSHTVKPFYHEGSRAQLPHRYSVLALLFQKLSARRKGP